MRVFRLIVQCLVRTMLDAGHATLLVLLREAQHVVASNGLLVILKAYPDGDDIWNADCLRLAKHYRSKKKLGLKAILKAKEPDFLIAHWGEVILSPRDRSFLYG